MGSEPTAADSSSNSCLLLPAGSTVASTNAHGASPLPLNKPSAAVVHLGHSCSLATLGWPDWLPLGCGHSPRSRKCSRVRY